MDTANLSLLVFNDKIPLGHLSFLRSLAPNWILFPITANEEVVESMKRGFEEADMCVDAILPVATMLQQTASDIKDRYVDYVESLTDRSIVGSSSIKDYFAHPFEDFSLWWLSGVFEKSNYKTETLHRLVKLTTILNICRDFKVRSVAYSVPDRFLFEDIARNQKQFGLSVHLIGRFARLGLLREILGQIGRTLISCVSYTKKWARVYVFRTKIRRFRSSRRSAPLMAVTYFPLIDKNALSNGIFVNRYFEPLQSAFGNREKSSISWLAMPVPIDGFSWMDALKLAEQFIKKGYGFYLVEEWLRFSGICKAVAIYLYLLLRFLRVSKKIREYCIFGNSEVKTWSTFRCAWLSSYLGPDSLRELINYSMFRACFKELHGCKKLIYLCENQSWEKAMCLAARDLPVVKIGIQHTSTPIFAPRLFFYSSAKQPQLPMPDYLACAGRIPAALHERFGFPAHKIVEWGALRYQHLGRCLARQVSWEEREEFVVVAGSILYQETRELLEWTALAIGQNKDIGVVLKAHPAQPYEPILNEFPEVCDKFEISHKPIDELLSKAKGLIVSSSTCAIEGIALGCPVIVPHLFSLVDMNPLRDVSKLPEYVSSVTELRNKLRQIFSSSVSPLNPEACNQLVYSYFKFLDSNEKFLSGLPHAV